MEIKYYNDLEQRSEEWHSLRLGKLTASKVFSIVDISKKMKLKSKSVVLTAVSDVISELSTGFSNDTEYISEEMEWGTDNEDAAIELVKTDLSFATGGVTNSDLPNFWLSPDLLSPKKGFEIKCFSSKNHIKTIIENKIPSKHLPQVLSYMAVIPDLESVDLVLYDPRLKKVNLHIINADKNKYYEHICNLIESIKEFGELVNSHKSKFI